MSASAPSSGGGKSKGAFGLLAGGIVVLVIASNVFGGEEKRNSPVTEAVERIDGEQQEQDAPRIVHQATATEYLPMPKKSSGQWAEVPNRPHWTNCTGSKDGIETQYRAQPGGDWLPAKPSSTVYRWRYRSVDETERVLDRNWDTNPNCSTPVPS